MFPERLAETVDLLYQASFADHQPIHEKGCLTALLEKIFGAETTEHILQRVNCSQKNAGVGTLTCVSA